jgi:hypothetical protein
MDARDAQPVPTHDLEVEAQRIMRVSMIAALVAVHIGTALSEPPLNEAISQARPRGVHPR